MPHAGGVQQGRELPEWKKRGERAPRGGGAKRAFVPEAHRPQLLGALRAIDAWLSAHPGERLEGRDMHRILRRFPRADSGFFSRSQLVQAASLYGPELSLSTPVPELTAALSMRPVRTESGVAPVTVFTKPFPCPGECIFCPNDVRMPKSYLSDEPGAQRAEDHRFDPYRQTQARLAVYRQLGHATDKVELIVLGGTWSFYPHDYQRWFILRCFEALNDFGEGTRAPEPDPDPTFLSLPRQLDGRALSERYNQHVTRALRAVHGDELLPRSERSAWQALSSAQQANETAQARCVGLVVETRPDHIDEQEVVRLRRLGVTKLQLGIQSLDDEVLARNRRGHDTADSFRAIALLRAAGFKIHAHFMPNLLGSSPDEDRAGFERLFADPRLRPDELKVYPCSLIESAELMTHYERGEFEPYDEATLRGLIAHALSHAPRYCRLTRVIRDISSDDIVVGNKRTNLREIVERQLRAEGTPMRDIRAREVRKGTVNPKALQLRETRYETSVGEECFVELVCDQDRIAGFARLCLPSAPSFVPELGDAALLRELHVYGRALSLGRHEAGPAQHQGLGRQLVQRCAELSEARGFTRLSVISAVGTRGYYARLGFSRGPLYQHLELPARSS